MEFELSHTFPKPTASLSVQERQQSCRLGKVNAALIPLLIVLLASISGT